MQEPTIHISKANDWITYLQRHILEIVQWLFEEMYDTIETEKSQSKYSSIIICKNKYLC